MVHPKVPANGTNEGVLNGYVDGILLGSQLSIVNGDILGSLGDDTLVGVENDAHDNPLGSNDSTKLAYLVYQTIS